MTKKSREDHPPSAYLPDIDELIEVSIDMGVEYRGKFIYYFASESKKMLLKDHNSEYLYKIKQTQAYDTYENSGVSKLDGNGRTNIVISQPLNYDKDNDKTYKPHVHWKIQGENNTWSDKNYTLEL